MSKTPKGRVHFGEGLPPGDASPSEVSNPLFNDAYGALPDASAEAVIVQIDGVSQASPRSAPATPSAVRKDAAGDEPSDASASDDREGESGHSQMSPHEMAMLKYNTSARRLPRIADCYVEPQPAAGPAAAASPWVSAVQPCRNGHNTAGRHDRPSLYIRPSGARNAGSV